MLGNRQVTDHFVNCAARDPSCGLGFCVPPATRPRLRVYRGAHSAGFYPGCRLRAWIMVVDRGFVVDRGYSRAPDQPRSPDPPR